MPGENCWRTARADRIGLIVDGEEYFQALREACLKARESIFILAWDFDRREPLGRDADSQPLGEFLGGLVERNPGLDVYLLIWDFNLIYVAERELLQQVRLRIQGPDRLHVQFDGRHPPGASQHQKMVVIDDSVAFSGGFDLSRWRWDSSAHAPGDSRRTDPDGKPYPPFHDMMMVVEGEAARAVAEVARWRWTQSGSKIRPGPPRETARDCWPESVPAAFESHPVAISRTYPAYAGREPVREVWHLFKDSFDAARDYIYIENQYFTSPAIAGCLAARLADADGPEVVLVLPRQTGGWLEQQTMDVLRGRVLRQLQEADAHGRLRIFHAHQDGLGEECISIHAKLTIIDDRFLRVGSANASSRSMGLDSECDLAVEANDDASREAVAAFLDRLLAEHLGHDVARIARERRSRAGIVAAIDALRGDGGRTLLPLEIDDHGTSELLPEQEVVDPSEPINADYLVRNCIPDSERPRGRWRIGAFAGLLALLVGMALAWRYTPLGEWLTTERLAAWLDWFEDPLVRAAALTLGIAAATLVMVPLTLAVIAAGLLLDPVAAFLSALAGALVSCLAAFLFGRRLTGPVLRRYAGARLQRLSRELSKRGIVTVAVLRLVPVAPFTVVNLVAGASHLGLAQFLVGSMLGLAPGVLALTVFSGSLYEALTSPGLASVGVLVLVGAVIVVAALAVRRLLGSRRS